MKKSLLIAAVLTMLVKTVYAENASDKHKVAFPYIYSVKYLCGLQVMGPSGPFPIEPPVKPGNYATAINIHNYHGSQVATFRKAVIANGQPAGQITSGIMLANQAFNIDCRQIAAMLKPPLPPFIEGFIEIGSTKQLSVAAAYTAQTCLLPGTNNNCSRLGELSISVVPQQAFLDQ